MKISKKRWADLIWIAALIILLFTPLGKTIKIHINRLIAFSPDVVKQSEAVRLTNYNWDLKEIKTGKRMNLNSFKNQVVFINTWATWCPPCIAEMPEIQELYTDYKDKVTFLMVSGDAKEDIEAFMNTERYTFKNYTSISATPKNLNSTSIPYTIVLDKEGYIRVDKVGSAQWNHNDFRAALDKMIEE